MAKFSVGDIVTVRGYGGYAEIIAMEVDGITPQGHPKWLCTVRFGEDDAEPQTWFEGRKGKKIKNLHTFYAGRLTSIMDDEDEAIPTNPRALHTQIVRAAEAQQARKDKLRETMIEIAMLEAEMAEERNPK